MVLARASTTTGGTGSPLRTLLRVSGNSFVITVPKQIARMFVLHPGAMEAERIADDLRVPVAAVVRDALRCHLHFVQVEAYYRLKFSGTPPPGAEVPRPPDKVSLNRCASWSPVEEWVLKDAEGASQVTSGACRALYVAIPFSPAEGVK